jgi:hypothetical protein
MKRFSCKKGEEATHLLLDGGKLHESSDFLQVYIDEIVKGTRLYVVEQKTRVFKFFVDIDFVSDSDELDFIKVTTCLYEIVHSGTCILARAKPREVSGGTKYGAHIVWPNLNVTKEKAQSIRMKILSEMGSDWEKVIDASVYTGSGLRMLWSFKNEPDSTVYIPWGTCNDGVFTEFENKSPSVQFLTMFSIRTSSTETREEIPSATSSVDIEAYIRRVIVGQQDARVLKISKCRNKKDYLITTDSKYCENIKRCHKSNHVWFCMTTSGVIFQKCHDDECKQFTGKRYRIPSHLIPNERVLDLNSVRTVYDYLPDGWKATSCFIR